MRVRARGPVVLLSAAFLITALPQASATAQSPNVLLVGPAGTPGAQYTSIQDAINHAAAGDWVLVWPGIYHEKGFTPSNLDPSQFTPGHPKPSAVYITTPGLHLRGMNRDSVIVDGTNFSASKAAGTAAIGTQAPCPSTQGLQDPGVTDTANGKHAREGIMVWRTNGTSVENLSVCNSMENEIWWNQGDGTGNQQPMSFRGDYLTTTSTFYKDPSTPSAQYGIFTSDVLGPGIVDHSYANNMTDSSYYIGACRNCNTVLEHPHAENSALGLSSTNAGGNLIIENGEWNNNRTGLVSNAQNNDDFPSPEYGQCVDSAPPPGAGPNSCYVIRGNKIHDNNNPNTPGVGLTAVSAIGTGVELAATQHISVINNQIYNQGSWGAITHDFPDPENGPAACNGGIPTPLLFSDPSMVTLCTWFSLGNYVLNNQFLNNGGFVNITNGDIANQAPGTAKAPSDTVGTVPDPNCFKGNTNAGGLKEWPAGLQEAPCPPSAFETPLLTAQLVCATGAASLFTNGQVNKACPQGASYPQHNGQCGANEVLTPPNDVDMGVCFRPLSYTLSAAVSPTMPDPCAGVPVNAYCPAPATAAATPSLALPNTAMTASSWRLPLGLALGGLGALAVTAGARLARRRPRQRD